MALTQFANFSRATLSGLHTSGDLTFNLDAGQGLRFPSAPFYIATFNSTDFPDSTEAYWAGACEVSRVESNPTANTLPGLVRGVDGSSALNFDDPDKEYITYIVSPAEWLGQCINVDDANGAYSSLGRKLTTDEIICNGPLNLPRTSTTVTGTVAGPFLSPYVRIDMAGADKTVTEFPVGTIGDIIFLGMSDSSFTLTINDSGVLEIVGGSFIELDNARDTVMFISAGGINWNMVAPIGDVGT